MPEPATRKSLNVSIVTVMSILVLRKQRLLVTLLPRMQLFYFETITSGNKSHGYGNTSFITH
jgi:hypothetical protein